MFTWINKQSIKSDEGYSLLGTDRWNYTYIEGTRQLIIPVQGLFIENNYTLEVSINFSHWQPPFDKEIIDNAKYQKIIIKIKQAFTFMGINAKYVK